ncbi:NACHT domain-containing protein [Actinoplanes sp. NPDC049599]|uniref:NACHT domain-containing protein n=1 Tax=Actinoplanes sp. NPDC049599 TaxID=3363903 RepID=UPI00379B9D32
MTIPLTGGRRRETGRIGDGATARRAERSPIVTRRSGRPWFLGGAAVAVIALAVWALRRSEIGDVDPVSAAIGLTGLPLTVAGLVLAWQDRRRQQTDTDGLAVHLARAVRRREEMARRQLLGRSAHAIDLQFDLRQAPGHDVTGARRQGRLTELAGYYDDLRPHRMVITGAAGAGKTLLAIELMLKLLTDPPGAGPVPVRISAATWELSDEPGAKREADADLVRRWLVDHLAGVYRIPRRSAQALVDEGRLLPVVDGLDELDATDQPGYASRAGRAVRALNAYLQVHPQAPLVVTCRSTHYGALTADHLRIEDAARVEVRAVSVAQARTFLTARAADLRRWRPVLDRIARDRHGPLAVALATPWRLTLAAVVYEQRRRTSEFVRDPAELLDPSLATAEQVRDHLLELFIPAASGNTGDAARTRHRLAVLASYLHENIRQGRRLGDRPLSGTDLVPHELWPLAGVRRVHAVTLALLAAPWLVLLGIATRRLMDFSDINLLAAGALIALVLAGVARALLVPWPEPQRLSISRLRTRRSAGFLAALIGFGAVIGFLLGAVAVPEMESDYPLVIGGLAAGVAGHPRQALAVGIVAGLTVGVAFGVARPLGVRVPNPRTIVRDDLIAWLACGLAFGVVGALAGGIAVAVTSAFTFGFHISRRGGIAMFFTIAVAAGLSATPVTAAVGGLAFGLAGGLAFGRLSTFSEDSDVLAVGLVGLRYLAFLLCTRFAPHRLPWQLGRFLERCHSAGLLRMAGNGYQFRHRELQDHLVPAE